MTTRQFIAIFILLVGRLLSQPLPQWTSSIGSNLPYYFADEPKIKIDNAGDLVVCGNIMTGSNGMNMLLIKYTTLGSLIWLKTYNGINNKDDQLFDFVFDSQNNIYVTGKTTIGTNNSDVISIKFDSGGNFIWQNTFNGYCNRNDEGQSITIDNTNNTYIIGTTELDTSGWSRKLFLRKIDPSGTTLWSKRYGNDSSARCSGLQIKYLNNEVRTIGYQTLPNRYIVMNINPNGTYIFTNEAPFIKGMSSTFIDKFGNFYWGAMGAYKTTKINSTGTLAWIDSVGTNLPPNTTGDEVRAIVVDTLQNVYVTGRHYGATNTNADVLTVKYSLSGSIQWSKRYEYLSNNSADIGNSICLDSLLNVFVAGESQKTTLSNYDYVVIKYTNSGNQVGIIRYDDPFSTDDAITSLLVDKFGCIYVTGLTMDNLSTSNTTSQKYCSMSTDINEYSSGVIKVNAFPNPFTNETTISLPNDNANVFNLKLFNTTGQVIYEQIYSETTMLKINLPYLSNGLYHFVIKSADRQYHGKLVKLD